MKQQISSSLRKPILLAGIFILFSCKQIDPNKQVDEGKFEANVYSSAEIGWTITIPENWKIISRAQSDKFEQKGLDVMEEMVDGEIDTSGLKNLLGFQKNQFNIFQSTSEPFELEYPGEWEENNALLKEFLYQTYANQGIKVDSSETTIIKIDGLDFHSYKFIIYNPQGEVILNQLLYGRWVNGLDFGVNINYNNEADKKEMLDAWLQSKFEP